MNFSKLIEKIKAAHGKKSHEECQEPTNHIAILFHGGRDDDDDREIKESFDFWLYCQDPEAILEVDDNRLIICDSKEELEASLQARYPTRPGCTLLEEHDGDISYVYATEENDWRRRRSRYGTTDKFTGWIVLNTPLLSDVVDLDQVRNHCVEHGAVLISPSKASGLFVGTNREKDTHSMLMDEGFSPLAGQNGNMKLIWNPKKVSLRKWRGQVRAVEARQLDQFPDEVMGPLGNCVNPTNWPSGMPFSSLINGIQGSVRSGGWGHSNHRDDPDYGASTVLEYVKLARILKKGSTPWREYSGYSYHSSSTNIKTAITAAAPFARYVARHGSRDGKKLARWIMEEARHTKIEIPPLPKIPPKPFAKKRKLKPVQVVPVQVVTEVPAGQVVD